MKLRSKLMGRLNKKDEDTIISNYVFLTDQIDADVLKKYMFQERIIDMDDKESISKVRKEEGPRQAAAKLVDILLTSGPQSYSIFIKVLYEAGYDKVARVLKKQEPRPTAIEKDVKVPQTEIIELKTSVAEMRCLMQKYVQENTTSRCYCRRDLTMHIPDGTKCITDLDEFQDFLDPSNLEQLLPLYDVGGNPTADFNRSTCYCQRDEYLKIYIPDGTNCITDLDEFNDFLDQRNLEQLYPLYDVGGNLNADFNRKMRFTAYRHFVRTYFGVLDHGVKLPDCVEQKIKARFPW